MSSGFEEAPCLLANDDEAYTYNSKINRLSTLQETRMLQEAVNKGVSMEHLARALNVDVSHVLKKLNLLEGICPEAVALSGTGNSRSRLRACSGK